ncbi:MAG: hypothetical protein M3082_22185 [Candidatus Dormibacteraeota bacterium]|nr:hypothetical protein [Candidatus Dormibacteraeota bacterium]
MAFNAKVADGLPEAGVDRSREKTADNGIREAVYQTGEVTLPAAKSARVNGRPECLPCAARGCDAVSSNTTRCAWAAQEPVHYLACDETLTMEIVLGDLVHPSCPKEGVHEVRSDLGVGRAEG